jgi:NAD(P)-dependent dehydrogenase (short-subunit alcohol dehydrogenase family)
MIVVTGGANGIGAAVVERFVSSGIEVLLLDRTRSARTSTEVTFAEVDVTDDVAVREAIDFGRGDATLEALVCSAGIFDIEPAPTSAAFRHVIDINLVGTWNAMQACEPWFGSQASVVTVASVSGRTRSAFAGPAYVASKAGVIGLTRAMAARWGGRGIRVNCIAPGPIDTEMTTGYSDRQRAELTAQIPLGRFGTAEEMAGTVAFLCSPASGFITGAVIDANGGMFMP